VRLRIKAFKRFSAKPLRKRTIIFLSAGLLLSVAVQKLMPRLPRFEGKTVEQWLDSSFFVTNEISSDFVQSFGVQAIPELTNFLQNQRRIKKMLSVFPILERLPNLKVDDRKSELAVQWISMLYIISKPVDFELFPMKDPILSNLLMHSVTTTHIATSPLKTKETLTVSGNQTE
jgi:hypothetical protein